MNADTLLTLLNVCPVCGEYGPDPCRTPGGRRRARPHSPRQVRSAILEIAIVTTALSRSATPTQVIESLGRQFAAHIREALAPS